ncbi:MAG: helix-turn-helix domain-containing protein [Patescibacteria group bacterium]
MDKSIVQPLSAPENVLPAPVLPPVEVVKEEEAVEAEGTAFRIEQLFGSRTRARLLGLFLENSERSFFVRELARRIDAQLNSVRRELKNLVDIGIVLEVDGEMTAPSNSPVAGGEGEGEEDGSKIDNKRFYQANSDFPIFDDLRGVMKKVAVLMNHTLTQELAKHGKLDLLVLTGSFTDVPSIPTDILVVGELKEEGIQRSIAEFEKEIGREVNYTYMPREEFEYRRDVGDRFLASILQGKRVVLTDSIGRV